MYWVSFDTVLADEFLKAADKEKYETHLERIRQSGGHSHFTTPLDPFLEYIAQFYNSDELVARIYEAFELFDVDGDGVVTYQVLGLGFRV